MHVQRPQTTTPVRQGGKLSLALLIRRVNAGLHLVPSLVTRSTGLLKRDFRIGPKDSTFSRPRM
jgi:hypothetical protein